MLSWTLRLLLGHGMDGELQEKQQGLEGNVSGTPRRTALPSVRPK